MFDKINELVLKLSLNQWLYVCLGVLAVVFVFGFIFSFSTGQIKKFKKAAKRSLKTPFATNVSENAKLLPVTSRKLFERAKNNGEKPSDVMRIDAVILAPSATSFAAKFTKIMLATSAFMAAFMYAIGFLVSYADAATVVPTKNVYTALALVVTAGFLLSFLAGLVSAGIRSGAVRTYAKYMDMLDSVILPSDEKKENAQDAPTSSASNEALFAAFLEDKKPSENVEVEVKPAVIIEEAKPIVTESPEQKAKAREQAAKEEQAKLAAIAAKEEQARLAAIAANNAAIAAQAKANAVKAAQVDSADEVIAKIDRISREGAPFSEMKEVAQELQQERSKPENKTPEQARKLNDALTTLLRAMSNATRR